jgi:hypothetical protein
MTKAEETPDIRDQSVALDLTADGLRTQGDKPKFVDMSDLPRFASRHLEAYAASAVTPESAESDASTDNLK